MSHRAVITLGVVLVATPALVLMLAEDDPDRRPLDPGDAPRRSLADRAVIDTRVPPGCAFVPGQRMAFEVSSESRFQHDPTTLLEPGIAAVPTPAPGTSKLAGTMLWHVLDGPELDSPVPQWTVAVGWRRPAALADAHPVDERSSGSLLVPIRLRIEPRCRITEIVVPTDLAAFARERWRELLPLLQVITPGGPGDDSWTAVQHDANGSYLASYRRAYSRRSETIERRRSADPDARPHEAGLSVQILRSLVVASPRRDGCWYDWIEATEHLLLVTEEGKRFSDVDRKVTVMAIPVDDNDPFWAVSLDSETTGWALMSDFMQADQPVLRFAAAAPIPGLAERSVAQVLAEVRRLSSRSKSSDAALNLLVQFARLGADNVLGLFAALRIGTVPEALQSSVFQSVQLAGGAAARDALIKAIDDPELGPKNQLRAISALAQVPDPDQVVVAALQRTWENRGARPSEKGRAALLALGLLVRHPRLDTLQRRMLGDELTRTLADADSLGAITNALQAIGKSGDPGFESVVLRSAMSKRIGERSAAYEALNAIGRPVSIEHTFSVLATDGAQPMALRELDAALTAHLDAVTDEQLQEASRVLMTSALDKEVRRVLIRFLGAAGKLHVSALEALVRYRHRETDPELLRLAGTYLARVAQ